MVLSLHMVIHCRGGSDLCKEWSQLLADSLWGYLLLEASSLSGSEQVQVHTSAENSC